MALQQEITVTVKGYTVTLSKPLTLFVNDSLDLIITLKQFGIKNPNTPNGPLSEPFDLTDLTVIMYVETANGTDELESTTVVENVITFPIKPIHTGIAGKGKMQIILLDRDGKRLTLPAFEYDVKETINDNNNIPLPADVHALSNETRTIIATSAEQYVELGGGIIELTRVKMTELPKVEIVKNTDIVLLETAEGSRTATKENLLKEVNANIEGIVDYQGKSNIDITGKEHDTLESRLRADNTILVDKVNNATYLPYEEEYITAANSYLGETKGNVIKGRTLQNLATGDLLLAKLTPDLICTGNSATPNLIDRVAYSLKDNTTYTIFATFDVNRPVTNKIYVQYRCVSKDGTINEQLGGIAHDKSLTHIEHKSVFTIPSNHQAEKDFEGIQIVLSHNDPSESAGIQIKNLNIMVLEGDIKEKPRFFRSIKSVNEDEDNLKEISCGKNLFDDSIPMTGLSTGVTCEKLENGFRITSASESASYSAASRRVPIDRFLGRTVTFYADVTQTASGATLQIMFYDITGKPMYYDFANAKATVKFPSEITNDYLVFRMFTNNTSTPNVANVVTVTNIQFEYGENNTAYEPYIEFPVSIRMKNLRSLGNICDTSDGVRKVGKIIFSGGIDEKWEQGSNNTLGTTRYSLKVNNVKRKGALVCNNICVGNTYTTNDVIEINDVGAFVICKQFGSLDLFKAWLKANPVTIYYELATPIIEVGNMEQMITYDGITNIFQEGSLINGLISCSVPSNVPEVLQAARARNVELEDELQTTKTQLEDITISTIEINLDQECRLTMLELGI